MKILTILGARPQFIKAGTVSREILKHKDLTEVIIHTGQHYDSNMSDIFFEEMKIPKPHYYLGIGGSLQGAMTGQMVEKIEEIALTEKPQWILVYGDTNTTLAGALVASKLHIKLAHIEAGLRSYNMKMPEEVNRILTDRLSNALFCPTQNAVNNLNKEGFPFLMFDNKKQRIKNIGDVMYDGALFYQNLSQKPSFEIDDRFALCTIHRAENTNDSSRLKEIIDALNHINQTIQIILPLHPRTRKVIQEHNIDIKFTVIEPVGYLQMVWLINNCQMIFTDSGGLQKESYFFEKPCITLRDETEWIELVEHNFNVLVGSNTQTIINAFENITNMNRKYDLQLFGDGNACEKIIKELLK